MTAFWDGFEKRGSLQKEAIFGALGAHLAQNVLMQKLIRSKRFGGSLAGEFQHGLAGRSPGRISQFIRGMATGATAPEIKMMKDHAREMGGHVAQSLREQGVTHLKPQDISLARSLTQGRFSRLLDPKHFQADNPTHQAILNVANKHLGTGITPELLRSSPEQLKPHLGRLEEAWRSKKSPVTSNLFSQLTKNPGKPGFIPRAQMANVAHEVGNKPIDLRHKSGLAGGLVGSAATGVIDPATGALNASKIMTTNPAGRALVSQAPLGQKALVAADKHFFTQPIQNAAQQGLSGQRTSPIRHAVNSLGLNAATAEMAHSANQLGAAASNVAPRPLMLKRALEEGY
jgi:hypothetical protein